ncbi:hypothetical protein ACWIGW_33865 [Nocardia brasiliensis]
MRARDRTIVRERDGALLLTDGPFTEGAEVVDGLYVFTAASPARAGETIGLLLAVHQFMTGSVLDGQLSVMLGRC